MSSNGQLQHSGIQLTDGANVQGSTESSQDYQPRFSQRVPPSHSSHDFSGLGTKDVNGTTLSMNEMNLPHRQPSFGPLYNPFSPGLTNSPLVAPYHHESFEPLAVRDSSSSGGDHLTLSASPMSDMLISPERYSKSLSPIATFKHLRTGSSSSDSAAPNGCLHSNLEAELLNKPIKKRACEQCNTSKVKCDGLFPCQKCTKRNIQCKYPAHKKRHKKSPHQTAPSEFNTTIAISLEESPTLDRSMEPQPWMYLPNGGGTVTLAGNNAMNETAAHKVESVGHSLTTELPISTLGLGPHSEKQDEVNPQQDSSLAAFSPLFKNDKSLSLPVSGSETINMGIAPAAIQNPQGLGQTQFCGGGAPCEETAIKHPPQEDEQIFGIERPNAPSLTDIKEAWRQFAQESAITAGSFKLSSHTNPSLSKDRNFHSRSNSVPELIQPSGLFESTAGAKDCNGNTTSRAESDSFSLSRASLSSVSPTISSVELAAQSQSPTRASQSLRGSSNHSSVSMVETMLPTIDETHSLQSIDGEDSSNLSRKSTLPPSRPKISVVQATASLQYKRGGFETLAPERAPSYLDHSFLGLDARDKVAGPQSLIAQKFSSLAARPGNKRMPSQTLMPDALKRHSATHSSKLVGGHQDHTHIPSRRFSVPSWVGSSGSGGNDWADSEDCSLLQAAFPGIMPGPGMELTPTVQSPAGLLPVISSSAQ